MSQDLYAAGLLFRSAAEIVPEAVEWLWQDNFSLGKVAVVAGPAGAGKTPLVAGDFAARVSTDTPGRMAPCGRSGTC